MCARTSFAGTSIPTRFLGYRCLPLVAQGETVGLLYLEEAADYKIDDQDLAVFTETTAFALANLRLRERLRNQSVRDVLTGLFNRRYLEETLELEFARARREQRPASIIMLDIDHFKRFNDLHGHDAGDLVLKAVGQVIKGTIRTSDIACRYGGEEFMLVLPGNTVEEAAALAERVRTATEQIEISHNNATLGKVTMSLGVRGISRNGDLPADVVAAADRALYAAKGAGRNTFAIAPLPVAANLLRRLSRRAAPYPRKVRFGPAIARSIASARCELRNGLSTIATAPSFCAFARWSIPWVPDPPDMATTGMLRPRSRTAFISSKPSPSAIWMSVRMTSGGSRSILKSTAAAPRGPTPPDPHLHQGQLGLSAIDRVLLSPTPSRWASNHHGHLAIFPARRTPGPPCSPGEFHAGQPLDALETVIGELVFRIHPGRRVLAELGIEPQADFVAV